MTPQEAIGRLKAEERLSCGTCIHPQEIGYCEKYCKLKEVYALAIKALEKQIPRADAEELDCENCIWNNYPVYFKNKCVPCELLKCDCFSKVMYEDWSDMNE